jgi:flagellar assembly protein FliH
MVRGPPVTPRPSDGEVVLRDTLFVPGAVRLPRGPSTGATGDGDRHPVGSAPPEGPAAGYAQGLRAGREEGLRSGREEGQRAGYEDGLRRGSAAAQEETRAATQAAVQEALRPLAEKAQRLDALLCALGDAAQDAWAGAEEEVLALCYETLCRVLGEAAAAPEALRAQVARLLAGCGIDGGITLHLHPADARLLDEAASEGQLPGAGGRAVSWRADPGVALGGCIVAGAGGGIDARLETVLEQCKAGLLQARAGRAATRAAMEAAQ